MNAANRPAIAAICALSLGFALLTIGLVSDRTLAEIEVIRVEEWSKLAAFLFAAAAVGALVLRMPLTRVLLLLLLAAAGGMLGLPNTVSLVVLALFATALGTLVVPTAAADRGLLSLSIGLCVLAAAIGWLLPFPVHETPVYWAAAAAAIWWRRASLMAFLRQGLSDLQAVLDASRVASFSALVVAGIAAIPAVLPLLGYDDQAYHMRLPWQLAGLGYFRMDVQSQVWSVAPWAGDALTAALAKLSSQPPGGGINLLWLPIALAAVFGLTRQFGAGPRLAWWSVALYASLPFTGYLTGTLQTELPSTALLGLLCLVVARAGPAPDATRFRLVLLLLSGLAAFKTSNAIIVIPASVWLLCKWRGRLPLAGMVPSVTIALFIAGSSYAYGAYLTGNPVLPLFNGVFHSPYFGNANFYDRTWSSGFTATLPWKILFDTTKYGEVWDGAAGFSMLLLCGAWVLAVAKRETRGFALVAAASWLLPLLVIQYARYAYPGMLLMASAGVLGLAALERRVWIDLALMLVVVVNVIFQANAHWILRSGYVMQALEGRRAQAIETIVPEIGMSRFVRDELPADARVVLPSAARPYTAEMPEKAFTVAWYDPYWDSRNDTADADASGQAWLDLFEETGVTHVAIYKEQMSPGLGAAVAKRGFREAFRSGEMALLELTPSWRSGRSVGGGEGIIRSESELDRAGPALLRAFVEVKCSKPGAWVAVAWHFSGVQGKNPGSEYRWVPCRYTGIARDEWATPVANGQGVLAVELSEAQPGSGLDLSSAEQGVWLRRDLLAERDLAKKMRVELRALLRDAVR